VAVACGLRAVPVARLFDATVGMFRHLEQAAEAAKAQPDDPSVMLAINHAGQLRPALERALWEAGQLEEKPPRRMTVSADDIAFPILHFEKIFKLVEIVEVMKVLAADLDADIQKSMSPSKRGRRRGRPTFELLSRIRTYLHEGGFSVGRIAWLVPDGPSDTDEQREAAMQRVKHGLRRVEQTAHKAS
jgi:hypothetical protein